MSLLLAHEPKPPSRWRVLPSRTYQIARFALSTCFFALALLSSFNVRAKPEPNEAELRAAVIVGVLRFTSWPEDLVKADLNICLAGQPTSEPHLLSLDGSHKIKTATVQVRHIKNIKQLENCNTLVLGPRISKAFAKKLIESANSQPIVSLCDDCASKSVPRATIYLSRLRQKIQFEVDWRSAKRNGVRFDSSLLELAVSTEAR